MHILIVEDENTVAARIERFTRDYFEGNPLQLNVFHSLDDADDFLSRHPIDLLFLDLNLAGRDGFNLLKLVVAESFHCIVISAYAERALEAFEYGVLDFIAKPFTRERFNKAMDRFKHAGRHQGARYLAIKRQGKIEMIELSRVLYFQGANIYSEVVLDSGETLLHDKPLNKLEQILPAHFSRVHKSYLANFNQAAAIHKQGNKAVLRFHKGQEIPISRSLFGQIQDRMI
ncbi:LytTR family DNA-binding domain-containing protein [Aliiglaciecola sp. CAU 1673]|uniref:LytR/AlgR family response regulator transcription factor n=1 Tax=Aliiglaciecola sp. CAU 1673 TaxID=3032595 RepID=UPI0023DBF14C|nr:LytTR family DNA-binding domain-containing protein [Aliiglaciecola sp. CAU 1673]MDF2177364.1 LytTR family DNA-binding domain-containing protein [Aliiglaciecola sp. CAU 1673]